MQGSCGITTSRWRPTIRRSNLAGVTMNSALPPNEPERLGALRRYHILDTPPDGTFDHLTAVAAALFRVPIAIVIGKSFVPDTPDAQRRLREVLESMRRGTDTAGGKLFGPDGAAALLGMKPTTLSSRIKAMGLNRNRSPR